MLSRHDWNSGLCDKKLGHWCIDLSLFQFGVNRMAYQACFLGFSNLRSKLIFLKTAWKRLGHPFVFLDWVKAQRKTGGFDKSDS